MNRKEPLEDRIFIPAGESSGTKYDHLIEHIQDAVVEFELRDGEPIIRFVNEAFVDVFGYDPENLRGSSLDAWIVPDWRQDEATQLNENTAAGEVNYRRVKRETVDGLREFLYRGIPVKAEHVETDGFAVYTDLTEITRNERRLQVMNRVLRHNLRNKLNIITGHTARLLEAMDQPTSESIETVSTVERATEDLKQLTEEAAKIREIIDRDVDGATIDCVPVIRRVAGEYRQRHPTVDIETDLPETMDIAADSRIRFAIGSLVDNAITHNPAANPRVRVRVRESDAEGWARIHVADDAPQIPSNERQVVTGRTEISPTRHGRGLGLWLVKWTTELFGGDLEFSRSDLGGNDVRMLLPCR
jgi:PAS domain S-box-containing protein